jgi:protein transport protein SEC13
MGDRSKGTVGGGWTRVKEHTLHSASVNSVSWAPHELYRIFVSGLGSGSRFVHPFEHLEHRFSERYEIARKYMK